MASGTRDERLDVRLPRELKRTIEQAAAQLGQTVSHFVVTTATARAHEVLRDQAVITLSNRDRDRFLTALDDPTRKPSPALVRAARRSKKALG